MADIETPSPPVIDGDELVPCRDDLFLVARNQLEMQACQDRMLLWFDQQVLLSKRNERELRDSLEVAKRCKWRTSTLAKQLKYALERKEFLVKCRKAIEAGYAIIPDMPAEVFAIRVRKEEGVRPDSEESTYRTPSLDDQPHAQLPAGEGDYVSNRPVASYPQTITKTKGNGEKYEVNRVEAVDFKPVQFPVIAARVRIMEASEQALSLKVFDELAVAPPRKKRDPMILGRIYGPRKHRFDNNNMLTFIVCWFLNLEELG